jgi:hypothetical protein
VLSDQNFPSVIPVEGEGDCFKIIQVENASLSDLTMVFLAALESFTVPAGTIVLISSVSHLAAVGMAAYAEDLVRAFRAIRAVYTNGVTVLHGIPLLLLEIGAWYQNVSALSTTELSSALTTMLSKLRANEQPISDIAPAISRAPEKILT